MPRASAVVAAPARCVASHACEDAGLGLVSRQKTSTDIGQTREDLRRSDDAMARRHICVPHRAARSFAAPRAGRSSRRCRPPSSPPSMRASAGLRLEIPDRRRLGSSSADEDASARTPAQKELLRRRKFCTATLLFGTSGGTQEVRRSPFFCPSPLRFPLLCSPSFARCHWCLLSVLWPFVQDVWVHVSFLSFLLRLLSAFTSSFVQRAESARLRKAGSGQGFGHPPSRDASASSACAGRGRRLECLGALMRIRSRLVQAYP